MELYGIIGERLAHSFSPAWFKKKFIKEGIEADYLKFELKTIDEFPVLIQMQPQLKGLNVTVPYKESIIPYLDETHSIAGKIGAVNTIGISHDDKGIKLTGYNTDTIGFGVALQPLIKGKNSLMALILGTGGSAKAVAYTLDQMGVSFQFVSRKGGKGKLDYASLNETVMQKHLLIINTTPLGTYPGVDAFPNIPYQFLHDEHILFDLVYNPDKTAFIARGEAMGARVENGLKMLRAQADASWAIWQEI